VNDDAANADGIGRLRQPARGRRRFSEGRAARPLPLAARMIVPDHRGAIRPFSLRGLLLIVRLTLPGLSASSTGARAQ